MSALELLTPSRVKSFKRCAREHRFKYVDRIEPLGHDLARDFGTVEHHGLESFYRAVMETQGTTPIDPAAEGARRVEAGIAAIREHGTKLDAFELVRAELLLTAYAVRWAPDLEDMEILAVEAEYLTPLVNPNTGAASKTFASAGKIDVIFRRGGREWVMEHKTSSEDISPGSEYWSRLRMDGQIGAYFDGAASLGHDVAGVLYDVILKPAQRPLLATPVENRKYKADGKLYANQRDRDETPEEFRERLTAVILEDPARYFGRAEIMRLEDERREHLLDTWQLATIMRDARRMGIAPRNGDACQRFGRTCAYFPICAGQTSADDFTRYQRRELAHPELSLEIQNPKPKEGNHDRSTCTAETAASEVQCLEGSQG